MMRTMASPAVIRQRRIVAVSVLGAIAAAAVIGGVLIGSGGDDASSSETAGGRQKGAGAALPNPPQLPGAGRRLFPDRRVVASYGNPRADELGALGIGT